MEPIGVFEGPQWSPQEPIGTLKSGSPLSPSGVVGGIVTSHPHGICGVTTADSMQVPTLTVHVIPEGDPLYVTPFHHCIKALLPERPRDYARAAADRLAGVRDTSSRRSKDVVDGLAGLSSWFCRIWTASRLTSRWRGPRAAPARARWKVPVRVPVREGDSAEAYRVISSRADSAPGISSAAPSAGGAGPTV